MIRQGDVLLKPIEQLPKNIKKKDNILAYGEITGHHHRFGQEAVGVTTFKDNTNNQFCELKEISELAHEDHANIMVPKGLYQVVIQQEYDLVEGIRQVMD